jgi:two-component system, NarL family, nitrate/nitrite response regulator NarL
VRAQPSEFPIKASIISGVRFFRESLAEVLARDGRLTILNLFDNLPNALPYLANNQPDIILLDEALPDGLLAIGQIRSIAPELSVVVIALTETAEEVIAWAEAGATGYISKNAALADIVPLLVGILQGAQPCSGNVAAGLLRRISNGGASNSGHQDMSSSPALTTREAQIAQMIAAGMSNKDIARRLGIGLATTKTHVHHLLAKLNVQRRSQAAKRMREQRGRYSDLSDP